MAELSQSGYILRHYFAIKRENLTLHLWDNGFGPMVHTLQCDQIIKNIATHKPKPKSYSTLALMYWRDM